MSRTLPSRRLGRLQSGAMWLLVGAVCGVGGYYFGKLAADLFPGAPGLAELGLRWSDGVAALVALAMLVASAAVGLSSLNRPRLGALLKLEGPATDEEVGYTRLQAAVMGLSALILFTPVVFSFTGLTPAIALAVVVGLLLVHTIMNLRVYLQADELLRQIALESGAVTFWLGQGVLFVWAAAERLGAATAVTSWDIYVCLMAVYLGVAAVMTARRGLA